MSQTFNPLDIAILLLLALGLVHGLWKGFVRDVFWICGAILAVLAAARSYIWIDEKLIGRILPSPYGGITGFLLVFTLVFLAMGLLGRALWKGIRNLDLVWLDRIAGASFGLLKGILISCGIVILLLAFLPKDIPLLKESRLTPYMLKVSKMITRMAPPTLKQYFDNNINALKRFWRRGVGFPEDSSKRPKNSAKGSEKGRDTAR